MGSVLTEAWIITNYPVFRAAMQLPLGGELFFEHWLQHYKKYVKHPGWFGNMTIFEQ